MSTNVKVKVQSFGRFLSNMIMPNIGALIAWGLITALFIEDGWLPNEKLALVVGPIIIYLLPVLIAYTGGKIIYGERGAVVSAVTIIAVIASAQNLGSDSAMFLGAMICGPLGGFAMKLFDKAIDGHVKSGFEMLVNNFSAGIIGVILVILGFYVIAPSVLFITQLFTVSVNFLAENNLLPLMSIIVEPAKILFLNNAINHGVLTPFATSEAQEFGKSIFFLVEANPGPGLGILLAYLFFGKGSARSSAGGAAIIHFFGGIHEIYFPYVLMKPRLIIAVILGGMTGVLTLTILGGGLRAASSPGSILAIMAMTPNDAIFANIAAVALSFIVTFLVAAFLIKLDGNDGDDLDVAKDRVSAMKAQSKSGAKGTNESTQVFSEEFGNIQKIIVACDAGMGSSAMGASILKKKVKEAGLDIVVTNVAINDLPKDADIIVTHRDLTERAMRQMPHAKHLSLNNFLDSEFYDELVANLVSDNTSTKETDLTKKTTQSSENVDEKRSFDISSANVLLGLKANSKEEAIRIAGNKLIELGYVKSDYVEAMLEREQLSSTYLGESIAIPHGTIAAKESVMKTGIVFCQYPSGVQYGEDEGELAHIVIGIAAKNNEHLSVIQAITNALDCDGEIERLINTDDVNTVLAILK